MKKLLALLLALCLIFSFTACSKESDDEDSGKKEKGESTAATSNEAGSNSGNNENTGNSGNSGNTSSGNEDSASNTYETPLDLTVALANAQTYSAYEKASYAVFNGFCEDEMKAITELQKKSDSYDADAVKESFEAQVDAMKEEYGDNYKFSYTINNKEKLDSDKLKAFEDELGALADFFKSVADAYNNADADGKQTVEDNLGLSQSDTKTIIENYEKLYNKMSGCKVTEGYELEIVLKTTGSELNEPEEETETICVYKVDGRWISEEVF